MLNLGPFISFLLISYIGNNENPPITDEICWSLVIRYCGAQLYKKTTLKIIEVETTWLLPPPDLGGGVNAVNLKASSTDKTTLLPQAGSAWLGFLRNQALMVYCRLGDCRHGR